MVPRRDFLAVGAAATVTSLASATNTLAQDKNAPVRVGVMGLSRGQSLALDLAKLSGVEVATLCDVDQKRLTDFNKQFQEKTGKQPSTTTDF
jgi:hypothetical protein